MKTIQWRSRALRDLNSLDQVVARRVVVALERYAATGHGDVIRLQDSAGRSRLRVGDWRILFEDVEQNTVLVVGVSHRSQAYR